jgi:hypothetical protein
MTWRRSLPVGFHVPTNSSMAFVDTSAHRCYFPLLAEVSLSTVLSFHCLISLSISPSRDCFDRCLTNFPIFQSI